MRNSLCQGLMERAVLEGLFFMGKGSRNWGAKWGVVGEGDKPGEAEKTHEFKILPKAQLAWLSG